VNGTERLAQEMLTSADALRQVRTALTRLVHDGHHGILGARETAIVLIDGLSVAGSLECLAGRLATSSPKE
jgi:hypothetical protein